MTIAKQDEKGTVRELVQAGGGTLAGQIEVAELAALGRDVLRETGARTPDEAVQRVAAGQVALGEVGQLRAAARAREVEDEQQARRALLSAAVHDGTLSRAQAFDVTEAMGQDGKLREVLVPKAAWSSGTIEHLKATLAALGAGAAPPRARAAPKTDEVDMAARAAAAGLTVEQYRRSMENVARGMVRGNEEI